MPWLGYSDDEVRCFHPVFEDAGNAALRLEGLQNECEWAHHLRSPGSGIVPDFVLLRRGTNRWVLALEIKRRPESVEAERNQAQAKSYAEHNQDKFAPGSPKFFAIGNLERTVLFAINGTAPPRECRLLDGVFVTGGLRELDEDSFKRNLVDRLRALIRRVLSGEAPEFDSVWPSILRDFINMASTLAESAFLPEPDTPNWPLVRDFFCHPLAVDSSRMFLLRCLFSEYFRGILDRFGHSEAGRLLPLQAADASRIGEEVARCLTRLRSVDFENLMPEEQIEAYRTLTSPQARAALYQYVRSITTPPSEIAELARTRIDRPQLLDGLLSASYPGEELDNYGKVMTDPELASLLAHCTIRDAEEVVCDPCCGTGSLLDAAYGRLTALGLPHEVALSRLHGTEADPLMASLALVRLILNEPARVAPGVAAAIRHGDMFADQARIANADVVLMNPPFKRYEAQDERPVPNGLKTHYLDAIRRSGGRHPIADSGQQNLYTYYVEYVVRTCKAGARVGIILDNKWYHSQYAAPLRQLLLDTCTLEAVLDYPYANLFSGWTIATSVLVARKRRPPARHETAFARCSVELDKVDASAVGEAVNSKNPWPAAWRCRLVTQATLSADRGWKEHFDAALTHDYLACLQSLVGLFGDSRRGSLRKEEGGVSCLDFPFTHKTFGKKRRRATGGKDRTYQTKAGAPLSAEENEQLVRYASAIPAKFKGFGAEHADELEHLVLTGPELLKEPVIEPPALRKAGAYGGPRPPWGPVQRAALKEIKADPATGAFVRAFRRITGLTRALMPDNRLWVGLREPTAGELIIPRKFRKGHKVHVNPFAFHPRGRQLRISSNVRSFTNCVATDEASGLDRMTAVRLVAAFLLSSFGQLQFEMLGYNREGCLCLELHQQDKLKVLDPRRIPQQYREGILAALDAVPFPVPASKLSDELAERNDLDRQFAQVLCSLNDGWHEDDLLIEVHYALDQSILARHP